MSIASVYTTNFVDPQVLSLISHNRFHDVLIEYLTIELIGSTLFYIMIASLEWPYTAGRFTLPLRVAAIGAFIGITVLAINISLAGGLDEFLDSFHQRRSVRRKVSSIPIPAYFLYATGAGIAMRLFSKRRRMKDLFPCLALVLLGLLVSSYSGGRKEGLLLVIAAIVFWRLYVGRLKIRASWIAAIGALFVVYTNGLAALRREGGMQSLLSDPANFITESLINVVQPFFTISYLSTYLLIIGSFSAPGAEQWNFAIFTSAPDSLVPRAIKPDKPPLDEGVYIYNLVQGWRGKPPTSMQQLRHSSMPPETIGNGYLVAGFPGAIAFFAVKGALLRLLWTAASKMYAPFSIVCTCYMAYSLEVSPLRIVQVGLVFAECLFFNWICVALMARREHQPLSSPTGTARIVNSLN